MHHKLLKITIAFCLARTLLAADEHKPEPKKVETHSPEPPKKEEAKKDEAKPGDKKETATHEPAKPSPVKAADPRPSATEVRRPTPKMTPRRNLATRASSRTKTAPAAKPVAPIVVEVKQEPARVEAILRIVPYGMPPAVFSPPGAVYPNQALSVSSLNTPRTQWPGETLATQNPAPTEAPRETVVGIFAPAHFNPAPAAPAYESPQPRNSAPQNTLKKAPKNALTNEGLVILAEAGYDEEFIIDLMKMKSCRFDTSAEGLAYMATHGLTERLIKATLQVDIESERKAPELEAHR